MSVWVCVNVRESEKDVWDRNKEDKDNQAQNSTEALRLREMGNI